MARDDDRGRGRGGFRYQERSAEDFKRRADGVNTNDPYLANNLKIYKAPEGDNIVRAMPPTWNKAAHYGFDVHIHYGIGSDNAAYLCLEKMKGNACPICEARQKATRDGDEEYAQELRPSHRVLMYILDREKERDGVQVWSIGSRMDSDIAMLCSDKRTGQRLNIDDPENGYDLDFVRTGTGMKTRYTGFSIARRSSPLDNDKALDFIQEYPLPDQLVYYSYDHIKKAFGGTARDDDPPRSRDRDDKDERTRDKDADDTRTRERTRVEEDRPARGSARSAADLPTWDEVHDLKFRQLEELVEEHRLKKVDPQNSRDDEELADWICEALDIEKPRKGRDRDDPPADDKPRARVRVEPDIKDADVPSRGRSDAPKDDADDNPRERMREMRRG